jgi:hypothetical protein
MRHAVYWHCVARYKNMGMAWMASAAAPTEEKYMLKASRPTPKAALF